MKQFCFSLMGVQSPIQFGVNCDDLSAFAKELSCRRFVEVEAVTASGEVLRAIVATSRIQLVTELES